ncbi:predicted protein [Sparassis crispa]|uniref:N-acetyltransferase domain-containing protein n=1 Tax=Sparassis crispa TaxID=139825 RepID=A0A401GV43_9APHY|nr:predicted protein [Sparassis crispa]GBE86066.1 predicted protein [Sparassis crispa]
MTDSISPHPISEAVETIRVTVGPEITATQLAQCAELFSENYGIWATHCKDVNPKYVPGDRVKNTVSRLKAQCLSDPERSILVTLTKGDKLIGHAFATSWDCGEDVVGWVTQLVVERSFRRQYIATTLLLRLKRDAWSAKLTIIGLASSQPASCSALAKFSHVRMDEVDTEFIARKARAVLQTSSVEYIKTAVLRGTLFGDARTDGVISSVSTNFPVDHTEPQEVLDEYVRRGAWKLGKLLKNDEFLILIPVLPSERFCAV